MLWEKFLHVRDEGMTRGIMSSANANGYIITNNNRKKRNPEISMTSIDVNTGTLGERGGGGGGERRGAYSKVDKDKEDFDILFNVMLFVVAQISTPSS